jgi:hypothetical protein
MKMSSNDNFSMPSSLLPALDPEGWDHDEDGEIVNGAPQSKGNAFIFKHARQLQSKGGDTYFKHSRPLQAADVLKMRVEAGVRVFVGFCGDAYDAKKHGETASTTAWVGLRSGTALVGSDISADGQQH